MSPYDRAIGALFGLAAGDRIGGPTGMALELMTALNRAGTYDRAAVLARYLERRRARVTDWGPITMRVLNLINKGTNPTLARETAHQESGGETAGCSPLHRCLPLAIAASIPTERLEETARQEALLTHQDPEAGLISALYLRTCRQLISGENFADIPTPFPAPYVRASARRELNKSGYAPEVLKAAVFFVEKSEDFEEALNRSIAFAGPPNFCPIITGGLAGARWGFSSIPAYAYEHCDVLEEFTRETQLLASTYRE